MLVILVASFGLWLGITTNILVVKIVCGIVLFGYIAGGLFLLSVENDIIGKLRYWHRFNHKRLLREYFRDMPKEITDSQNSTTDLSLRNQTREHKCLFRETRE